MNDINTYTNVCLSLHKCKSNVGIVLKFIIQVVIFNDLLEGFE